jgi:hypothetical protein
LKFERLVKATLVVRHLRDGHLNGGCFSLLWIDETHLADCGKFIEDIWNRTINPLAVQLSSEKTAKHQGENAAKDMHFHLLIGPMILGTQSDVMTVFHAAEGSLHMVLTAIAADDLHITPLLVIRKEDGLTEQCLLKPRPGTVVEAIAQDGQPFGVGDLHLKQLLHVPRLQPSPGFLRYTFHRGPTAAADFAFPVPPELILEIAKKILPLCDLPEQGSGLGDEEILVIGDQDRTLGFEHLSPAPVHSHSRQSLLIKGLKHLLRYRQQVRMLSRNQRANKMIGTFFDRLQVVLAVVSLVKNDGDLLGAVSDLAVKVGAST